MVELSPKAVRFMDIASDSAWLKSASVVDACKTVEAWRMSRPDFKPAPRAKIEVPGRIAEALLLMIDFILKDPARSEDHLDWDGNDIAFIDCIGQSIRQDLSFPVSR